jgi:hypothetical protein
MQGLAFHSFVHYFEEIPAEQQTNGCFIHDCVKAYIKIYTNAVYRGDNTVDCETPKIHAHLHLAGDIMDFGHPMNWDARKVERGLKDWAKVVSSTAHKQNLIDFTYQTAMMLRLTTTSSKHWTTMPSLNSSSIVRPFATRAKLAICLS